ncbi:MAG: isoleucine--tRNA ligase [Deltaproteobacteria bacterium]|nr:isoleucine--tRNA ligase [Deltaproteobacteria bacterium]
MFQKVGNKVNPKDEERILRYWEENRTFEKQVEGRRGGPNWVFHEGPPTANGQPHLGHILPRFFKDLFPRYRSMRGYYVERKGGWDTHGLPVELEVEKELGLSGKEGIERYGMENFIHRCKENVFKYKREWENMIRRFGFWIDLDHPYVTLEDEYIESVWWILKTAWDRNLLYQGHKIVPYCPRCGTPLSSHEVSQGYRSVAEESVTVTMPVRGEPQRRFLVWTTTPWTLPSNIALAVHRDLTYADVRHNPSGITYILAEDLVEDVFADETEQIEVLRTYPGREMLDLEYEPLFRLYNGDKRAYFVIHGDFVSTTEGTGLVHIAPAFGEEDYQAGREYDLPTLQPVDLKGNFTGEFPEFADVFVKDADAGIIRLLKERGRLFRVAMYTHDYPFCWRCETPLLYYAKMAWFLRTTAFKDDIITNNNKINWYPEFMGSGRFGDFLENMIDWALSRDRYWGTPLNIWKCEDCGHMEAVGSRQELVKMAQEPELARTVEFHKPYIDAVTLECTRCRGRMRRVPEVVDCWFDSGAMHTAQWHYPFENRDVFFKEKFPADFICEGQDQTRGWFYSLLVLSTLVYNQPAYLNVLGTGLGLDAEGRKMSKSLGNMIDPWDLVEEFGADVVRWYYAWSTSPWNSMVLSKENFREILYKFMGTLRNVVHFFVIYANIAEFDPGNTEGEEIQYRLADRWILSRLHGTIQRTIEHMDRYDSFHAARDIDTFVQDLSNWYIRTTRPRFWEFEMTASKRAAFATLHHVLVELARLLAPFIPFWAEETYLSLVKSVDGRAPESVHLCDYPAARVEWIDEKLEDRMKRLRRVVYLALQARNKARIKVRRPLRSLLIVRNPALAFIEGEMEELLCGELNIKEVRMVDSYDFKERVRLNYRAAGPRLGPRLKAVEKYLESADPAQLAEQMASRGRVVIPVDGEKLLLDAQMVNVEREDPEGFVSAADQGITVALDTRLDETLIHEGFAREVINKIQFMRKTANLEIMDRIQVDMETTDAVRTAVETHRETVTHETLCDLLRFEAGEGHILTKQWDINGQPASIGIRKV